MKAYRFKFVDQKPIEALIMDMPMHIKAAFDLMDIRLDPKAEITSGSAVLWQEEQSGQGKWVVECMISVNGTMIKLPQRDYLTETNARQALAELGFQEDGPLL